MSSIQEAMARIQEIMDRIRSLENLGGNSRRADAPVGATGQSASRAGDAVSSTGSGGTNQSDFTKLLEQALAAQTQLNGSSAAGATPSDLLSGASPQGALASLLGFDQTTGADASAGANLSDFTDALQSYQSTLIQALRQLAAEQARQAPAAGSAQMPRGPTQPTPPELAKPGPDQPKTETQ